MPEPEVTPHVSKNVNRNGVEECFGWMKTIALMRKVRHRGIEKVGWMFTFAAAAYNLYPAAESDFQPGWCKHDPGRSVSSRRQIGCNMSQPQELTTF